MRLRVGEVTSLWTPININNISRWFSMIWVAGFGDKQKPIRLDWSNLNKSFSFSSSGACLALPEIMSSSLLLYRLRCLFPTCHVAHGDDYLSVWRVYLRHAPSNAHIGFSDDCGAISLKYQSDFAPGTNARLDEDWLSLLNLLFDPDCSHPYAGIVAGCVA